jgi:hypothetical protein
MSKSTKTIFIGITINKDISSLVSTIKDQYKIPTEIYTENAPQTKREGLIQFLQEIATRTHKERLGTVIFYYSGKGFFVPSDDDSSLSDATILSALKSMNPNTRFLMFFDCPLKPNEYKLSNEFLFRFNSSDRKQASIINILGDLSKPKIVWISRTTEEAKEIHPFLDVSLRSSPDRQLDLFDDIFIASKLSLHILSSYNFALDSLFLPILKKKTPAKRKPVEKKEKSDNKNKKRKAVVVTKEEEEDDNDDTE